LQHNVLLPQPRRRLRHQTTHVSRCPPLTSFLLFPYHNSTRRPNNRGVTDSSPRYVTWAYPHSPERGGGFPRVLANAAYVVFLGPDSVIESRETQGRHGL